MRRPIYKKIVIVAKASDGQQYPCPAGVVCDYDEKGCRAAAPKGSMTYAFTHMRNFLLLLLLVAGGMAKLGRNWQHFTEFGRNWRSLAEFDGLWWDLAEFGKIWQSLAEFGRIWQNLAEFGKVWWDLTEFGRIRQSLAEFGRIW